MGHKIRAIYDGKHYKIQRILKNPEFRIRIKEYENQFVKIGLPVPPKGFSNQVAFEVWADKVGKVQRNILNSKEYKEKLNKISAGKNGFDGVWEKWKQKEELERNELPDIFEYRFGEILEKFELNPENRLDREWLKSVLFYKKKNTVYPHLLTMVKLTRNKQGEPEVWVKVFGHTRLKIKGISTKHIREFQKDLPDYVGKNKPRSERVITRNREVVDMYLEEKRMLLESGRARSPKGKSIASMIVRKLKKKYPELNEKLVIKIVRKELE